MKPWKPLPPVPFTSTIPEILDAIEGRWPEGRLANSDARTDVPALIARVRELEAECAEFRLRAEDEIANNVINLNAYGNQLRRLTQLETDIRDHVSYAGGNGLAALEDLAEEVRKTWVSVDDECIEMRAECERMKTFAAQNFSTMIRQEAEQMREYGLSYEGVRQVLREYNNEEISFGKLMDLIRAAARAMAEPAATYSEGETLLRAQAAEAQQLARQMMDERDKLRAECAALRRELAELMDDH